MTAAALPAERPDRFAAWLVASLAVHALAAGVLRAGQHWTLPRTEEMVIDLTGSFRTKPPRLGKPQSAARVLPGAESQTVKATPQRFETPLPSPVPGSGEGGVPDGVADGGDPAAALAEVTALPELLDRAGLRAKLEPFYPAALKAAGVEGVVTLEVVVSSKGGISSARALRSDPPGFEEPALAACRVLAFRPAYVGARPVAVRIRLPLRFQIER